MRAEMLVAEQIAKAEEASKNTSTYITVPLLGFFFLRREG